MTPQVPSCETLFLRFGSRDQLVLLLLYQPLCCIAASLPRLLTLSVDLAMEFLRLIVLGDFNLPFLEGRGSEVAWDYMETITFMGLSQVIHGPISNSGHTPVLIFLLEQ